MKQIIFIFMAILLATGIASAQNKAVISADETSFDFGTIKEANGNVCLISVCFSGNALQILLRRDKTYRSLCSQFVFGLFVLVPEPKYNSYDKERESTTEMKPDCYKTFNAV